MTTPKMHEREVHIDNHLVRRLIADQCPQWADLPARHASSSGTDNAMFRLGDAMVVRLPRIDWAAASVAHEQTWLPIIGPAIPVPTPTPLAMGKPAFGYPWHWSVYTWLDGANLTLEDLNEEVVRDIASCLNAVHAIDVPDGPVNRRGFTFHGRDTETRTSIAAMEGMVQTDAVTAVWDAAFELAPCEPPGTWIHSDTARGNLLVRDGRLCGLIDFSGVGRGDPAVDLGLAWNLLPAALRPTFRAALDVDDATWLRGRAWALSQACLQLPYYKDTNKPLAAEARYVIREVLADFAVRRS
ncbi:MAG: aminoglycoside phosphotransferase family protein [Actinomycetota bacterium]